MIIEKRFKSYNEYLKFLSSFGGIGVLNKFDKDKKEYVVIFDNKLNKGLK